MRALSGRRPAQPGRRRHHSSRSATTGSSTRGDRSQSAVFVLVVATVLFLVVVIGLTRLGEAGTSRLRAQTAAVELVAAHDAVLEAWRRGPDPSTVTVVVRIGDQVATARARLGG